jgi:hypothetical protein
MFKIIRSTALLVVSVIIGCICLAPAASASTVAKPAVGDERVLPDAVQAEGHNQGGPGGEESWPGGEPRVVVIPRGEAAPDPAPGEVTSEVAVGVGWTAVYIYLNRSNVNWLYGLGYSGATAVLCFWATSTGLGAFTCAGLSYVLWSVIAHYAYQVPSGYCLQIKITWWGSVSSSLVRRTC